MYSQSGTDNGATTTNNSDSRIVADILSSMANGDVITPTTLAVIEGFCTGIPTRTTPTLTPTTLRSFEQTYLEFQAIAPQNEEHEHQAGFVPPVVPAIIPSTNTATTASKPVSYQTVINNSKDLEEQHSSWGSDTPPPRPAISRPQRTVLVSHKGRGSGNTTVKTRGTGGRKPNTHERLSPEEEERRKVRRERNKLAAARCRKRRMDHTSSLVEETEELEDKKYSLQQEIQALQNEKEELEFILEAHRNMCKLKARVSMQHTRNIPSPPVKVKVEACYDHVMPPSSDSEDNSQDMQTLTASRPMARPTTLPILSTYSNPSLKLSSSVNATEATGIPIQTPSTGIFNFDALMEGGTGLTPVTSGLTPVIPMCSGQQRNSGSDMASPDSKLVSL